LGTIHYPKSKEWEYLEETERGVTPKANANANANAKN
jgi:hypothetical protein